MRRRPGAQWCQVGGRQVIGVETMERFPDREAGGPGFDLGSPGILGPGDWGTGQRRGVLRASSNLHAPDRRGRMLLSVTVSRS